MILKKLKLALSLLMMGLTISMQTNGNQYDVWEVRSLKNDCDRMKMKIAELEGQLVIEKEYQKQCAQGSKNQLDRLCETLNENQRLNDENSVLKEGVNYAAEKNIELGQKIRDLRQEIADLKRTASLAYKISEAIIDFCNCFHAPCFGFPVRIPS